MKTPAAIFCLIQILYFFWIDKKKGKGVSNAIWIPFIFLLFATSRPISFWLDYWLGIGSFSGDREEGNVIEQFFLIALMTVGILILKGRRLNWRGLAAENVWICVFFVFAALSFSWSDYPFVAFKRWLKTLGTVIMALVILTERRPYEAIGVILRRLAFIHLPLSVLFIKYYPGLGRFYHTSGATINAGVTGHKNSLGAFCLISGIYFTWSLLLNRWQKIPAHHRTHFSIYLILIPMLAWLLYKANSATSLACLAFAVGLLIVTRWQAFGQHPGGFMIFGAVCALLYVILEFVFYAEINAFIITMLGRRPDLTTRVPMWEMLLSMVQNPIAGFGFESFWLGQRADILDQKWGVKQAHNGYLDIYLSLGYVGLFLTMSYFLSGFKKIYKYLSVDFANAVFRLCVLLVFVFYNWTETAFHLESPLWMLLIFAIVDRTDMAARPSTES